LWLKLSHKGRELFVVKNTGGGSGKWVRHLSKERCSIDVLAKARPEPKKEL